MTRDDIIRMAREANCTTPGLVFQFTIEELERFAALVAAAEREECAKACESRTRDYTLPDDVSDSGLGT